MLAAMLAGCGSDAPPNDCSLATAEDEYIAGATLDDCGSPYSDGSAPIDAAPYQAAQSCALDHARQQHAFRVQWTLQGVEGPIEGAYVGETRNGAWTLAWFSQAAAPTGKLPPTTRFACTGLQASSVSSAASTDLGIECVGRTTAEQCMP